MTTQELLSVLEGVEATPNGWTAKCPAHDDNHASLTIMDAGDNIVCKCQAGCDFTAIIDEAKARLGSSGTPSKKTTSSKKRGVFGKIMAEYSYTDEHGHELYQSVRMEPKAFRVRHQDPGHPKAKKGGWVWTKTRADGSEIRMVPYRLPKVLAAAQAGKVVFVVEGEKDVATLEVMGLTATCNAMGAGKWRAEYSAYLEGAHVVILPDNDDAGRKHAEEVAASARGVAQSVRVVRLPGLPDKGDVTDWVEIGGGREELEALVTSAIPWEPRDERSITSDCDQGRGAIPPLVYELLPPRLGYLSKYPKTWYERDTFLTSMIGCLAAALPNVRTRYGGKYYSPHLYFVILANAGAGKGEIDRARRLVEGIDDYQEEVYRTQRQLWQAKQKAYEDSKRKRKKGDASEEVEPPGPEPPETYLLAGEDTTLAGLYDGLNENLEGLLLVTTELDGLSMANGRDAGGFSYLIRQCFHHERTTETRRGREKKRKATKAPRRGIVAAGTPDQFGRFLERVEDGAHSRVAVYHFKAPHTWQDQRWTARDNEREEAEEAFKADATELWKALHARRTPLYVDPPEHAFDQINEVFGGLLREIMGGGVPDALAAHIKRAGLIAVRIMVTLTTWRAYGDDYNLSVKESLTVSDADIKAGITLVRLYLEHSLRNAADQLKDEARARTLEGAVKAQGSARMSAKMREVWEHLPDGSFRAEDITHLHQGNRRVCHRATLFRHLNTFVERGLLSKDGVTYRKTPLDRATLRQTPQKAPETRKVAKQTPEKSQNENATLRHNDDELDATIGLNGVENKESRKVAKSQGSDSGDMRHDVPPGTHPDEWGDEL